MFVLICPFFFALSLSSSVFWRPSWDFSPCSIKPLYLKANVKKISMDVEGIKQEHQLISEKEQVEKQNMTPMMMMIKYILWWSFCLSVCHENEHFLLGVSGSTCNHPVQPRVSFHGFSQFQIGFSWFQVFFLWFFMVTGRFVLVPSWFLVFKVPGWFLWFQVGFLWPFMVPGGFFMVRGRFSWLQVRNYGFSWFQVGVSWLEVDFSWLQVGFSRFYVRFYVFHGSRSVFHG